MAEENEQEAVRLAAIDEGLGAFPDVDFSSDNLMRERREDNERDERSLEPLRK